MSVEPSSSARRRPGRSRRHVVIARPCATPFVIEDATTVAIHAGLRGAARSIALDHAREWLALMAHGASAVAAGLAAGRASSQRAITEQGGATTALPRWATVLGRDPVPDLETLGEIWSTLAPCLRDAPVADSAALALVRDLWPLLGSTEAIMETGGDIRLLTDPQSELNGYGCSHRPRPWAITFASSTASSSSERGYGAADRARLRVTAALLQRGDRQPLIAESMRVRRAIAAQFGGRAARPVRLAASGTDTEFGEPALGHFAEPARPITTILLAPEETGSGVPMAARGRHFAIDTANGHDVDEASPIEGFREDTELKAIPLRDVAGRARPMPFVEAEITETVAAVIASGRRPILHALDLSKTGLLAPTLRCLRDLRDTHGDAFDLVVDACQLRIAPGRVRDYLDLDAVVQITGSKFLTGPPFSGAALLPAAIAARLGRGRLPSGLDAYFGRGEWPATSRAAASLPATANYGLALRWQAALAEHRAISHVADAEKRAILTRFADTVAAAAATHGVITLLPSPPLLRDGDSWDRLRSIFAFAVRDPDDRTRHLDPTTARYLYHWLNADCSPAFERDEDRQLAATICHIGQPVSLPDESGRPAGWLRVSAGARLISGEPSHRRLGPVRRIDREMADLATVFRKIALLHDHWDAVAALAPLPRHRAGPG